MSLIKEGKSSIIAIKNRMENYCAVYFGQVEQWQRQGDFVWTGWKKVPVGYLNLHLCHELSADINLYWGITAGNWFTNVTVEEKQGE